MLGLLRNAVRSATTHPLRPVYRSPACQLSTFRPLQPGYTPFLWVLPQSKRLSVPSNSRALSLASIFSRSKPTPSPTPLVVAHITRLEAEANVHPHDVEKQLALFRALLDTKLKTSYDLIVNRWERMCEFVRERDFVCHHCLRPLTRFGLRTLRLHYSIRKRPLEYTWNAWYSLINSLPSMLRCGDETAFWQLTLSSLLQMSPTRTPKMSRKRPLRPLPRQQNLRPWSPYR